MGEADYEQFIASMTIDLEKWREGIGYDLPALRRMTAGERGAAEAVLIDHLHGDGDWRDVQALACLGTPCARVAVEKARCHRRARVRRQALRELIWAEDSKEPSELEELVTAAVEQGDFEMAERLPTPRVKRALLELARSGEDGKRCHAAAMLLYLCGRSSEAFDWDQRPFFLRFANEDPAVVRAAWEELRSRVDL